MADYRRSSRETSPDRLPNPIRTAIDQHIADRELGDVLAKVLFCCETTNERLKKPGLLAGLTGSGDPDPLHTTTYVVTPQWLIWARSGEKYGTVVKFMRLSEIEVQNYQFSHMIEDHGVSVLGFISDTPERASLFLGLGDDPAGNRFAEVLKKAVADAHQ